MSEEATRPNGRFNLALAVGYIALTGATVSAYAAPATGFEVSIYEGTPLAVWVSLGVALTLSLLVSFSASGTRLGVVGLVLGGGSVGLVTALPLVRGYRFYGAGDGLTHAGWVTDVASGVLDPFGLFYPGLHTVSLFFSELAGIGPMRSLLLVVLAFTVSFLLFVPLCVRAVTGRTEPAYVGAFVAFCLLPLNHIATHYMEPHPVTQTILFSPVVLYLLIQYVLCERSPLEAPLTRTGTLLALGTASVVLYPPQQAANTLVLFVTVSGIQAGCRLLRRGGEIRAHRPLYGQAIWLALVFAGWTAGRETFAGALSGVTGELAGLLFAGGTDAAAVVGQRGSSLGAIGASTSELFVKLLSIPTVFAGLTAFLMLVSLLGRAETTEPDSTALLRYFTAGLFVLVPYSLVFFVGSVSKLFFRNLGFVMVLVTILGAIATYRLADSLSERFSPAVGYPALTLFLGAALVFSMVVVFPSPYVFIASGHVTDDRLEGYEMAFAGQAPGTDIYGVRDGPWRYRHALAGVAGTETGRYAERSIAGENLTRAREIASEDRYFVLTRPDVVRETEVYEGLRYSMPQLRSLERQPGIHVVASNGEVTVYRIEARPVGDRRASSPPLPTAEPTAPATNGTAGLDASAGSDASTNPDVSGGPGTPAGGPDTSSGSGTPASRSGLDTTADGTAEPDSPSAGNDTNGPSSSGGDDSSTAGNTTSVAD